MTHTAHHPIADPHTDRRWFLGIDLGTGGLKAAAVTVGGEVLGASFVQVATTHTDDGGEEQSPDEWWEALRSSVRSVIREIDGRLDRSDCGGIGITGQWGSTVPVDADGTAIGPCLLWSDDRGAPFVKDLLSGTVDISGVSASKLLTWVRLTGGAPSGQGADPTGHVQFMRRSRPEVFERAALFLEPLDYLGLRLTGVAAATPASMVLSWLTDNRNGGTAAYHPALVRLSGRLSHHLPPLRPTGSVLGTLTAAVAAELGLPNHTRVVCGIPDLHTAAIGSGGIEDYDGHLAISTSAWVSAPVPHKKTDVMRQMAAIPGFRPGSYIIANNHDTGGATLRWLRDSVLRGPTSVAFGSGAGDDLDYDTITARASTASMGSGGVIFTPWLKGERSPVDDRNLRASFLNVSITTTGADLIRSILEGVAFNARWLLEATEKCVGQSLNGLRILGGGAQSDLWCQIHADVIGRTITQVAQPMHASVRGAAWFAAYSLGELTLAQLGGTSLASRSFAPHREAPSVYGPLYREFVTLAKEQKSMYERLNGGAHTKSRP